MVACKNSLLSGLNLQCMYPIAQSNEGEVSY